MLTIFFSLSLSCAKHFSMIKSFRSAFNVLWTDFVLVILLEDATHWLILHRIFVLAEGKLRYVMHGFCFAIGHFVYSGGAFCALAQGNRILWDTLLRLLVNRLDKISAEKQRQRFARELNPAILAFFAEKNYIFTKRKKRRQQRHLQRRSQYFAQWKSVQKLISRLLQPVQVSCSLIAPRNYLGLHW